MHGTYFSAFEEPPKRIVQIIAYHFETQCQLVEALTLLKQRCPTVTRLEIIGCPFMNSELVQHLSNIAPTLQSVAIYDCLNFDFGWAVKATAEERTLNSLPFRVVCLLRR